MNKTSRKIGEYLLQIKAIKLEPANPFTWASGWKSPIYCDNRKTLSYPVIRTFIRDAFAEIIREKYQQTGVIAGVATGAIAHGALIAQELDIPFVYVRPGAKSHGLGNKIEGVVKEGQKVLVIEDLISTGGSSLRAVSALRDAGCNVLGMQAIFTYGFALAEDNFKNAKCNLATLSNYNDLIELALESGYIDKDQLETLKMWRKDPANWNGGKNS
ncbi:MAG: orotate phosphoribosyltransferase [Bacteroidetes bacterium]|nr:orotate phosphoribosyltransferase [Bacteroidota bacterium]